MIEHFPQIVLSIHTALKENRHVLVHCYAGVSRSATAILAYLIWAQGMAFNTALKLLWSKRPVVNPNAGFREQLRLWELLDCNLLTNDPECRFKEEYVDFTKKRALKSFTDADGNEPDLGALRRVLRPEPTNEVPKGKTDGLQKA